MITYEKKNVLDVTNGVILHGCNAQGVMGAGVALAVRRKWPQAFNDYVVFIKENKSQRTVVGDTVYSLVEQGILSRVWVANAITQSSHGRVPGVKYASINAIRKVMVECAQFCKDRNDMPLYMPQIGCGYGGLDWERDVRPLVEHIDAVYNLPIYVRTL